MRDEARARAEDRNLYKRRKMREKTQREMSVSLTSATVIFTLYQCCADLCCREQSDSGHMTWLSSKGHLAWSINLELTLIHRHSQAYSCMEPALMAPLSL